MRKFIIILLISYANILAVSGFTYPWVLKANDTVTYTRWKGNNDTVQVWANRICDTVNKAVVHFNSSSLNHDSTVKFVNIDTIRSAPNIDSIKGDTRFTGSPAIDGTLIVAGGLTGNVTGNISGSSGSCTGNAATATTATNVSGGSVSATTGTFSSTLTADSLSSTVTKSTRLRADSAIIPNLTGNVGISAGTPKSWTSNYRALQIGNSAAIMSGNVDNSDRTTYFSSNSYNDGSWKSMVNGKGSLYHLGGNNGGHCFYSSDSVLANNTQAYTQTMNIDTNGNMKLMPDLAPTSTAFPTYINLGKTFADSTLPTQCKLKIFDDGATDIYGIGIGRHGNIFHHANSTSGSHDFYINNVKKASIDLNGITANLTGNVTGNVSGSSGSCTGNAATATTASACSGNAATVTNGVYTNGTYNDPSWITGLNANKLSGTFTGSVTGNVTGNASGSSGSCTGNAATATTASACSGNAATVTNGVYTNGTYNDPNWLTGIRTSKLIDSVVAFPCTLYQASPPPTEVAVATAHYRIMGNVAVVTFPHTLTGTIQGGYPTYLTVPAALTLSSQQAVPVAITNAAGYQIGMIRCISQDWILTNSTGGDLSSGVGGFYLYDVTITVQLN